MMEADPTGPNDGMHHRDGIRSKANEGMHHYKMIDGEPP
jgi:hypothetical protein